MSADEAGTYEEERGGPAKRSASALTLELQVSSEYYQATKLPSHAG